jgi:SAM-dependent methyltransferase
MDPRERDAMLAADENHWWYRGRRRVIDGVLAQLGLAPGARILDAGCGSGRMLDELARYGAVTGVDADPACVTRATERGHTAQLASLPGLPFEDASFDLVTSFDVVEHLPEDVEALADFRRVAVPGGRLLSTVPAYQWLWSDHDVVNRHQRRYTARSFAAAATAAGWTVERDTYFNSLLLAPAAAVRLAARLRRNPSPHLESDLEMTPRRLDWALEQPMRLEAALIRRGVRLPAGLSLLTVCVNGQPARVPQAGRIRTQAAAPSLSG